MAIWKKDNKKEGKYNPPDSKLFKEIEKDRGTIPSIISEGSEFKGNIKTSGEIQIDGLLNGDVKAKQIVVGINGKVRVLSDNDLGHNEFFKLDILGGMMLTSTEIEIYKGGITPAAFVAVGSGGASAGAGVLAKTGYTTQRVKLRKDGHRSNMRPRMKTLPHILVTPSDRFELFW